MHNPSGNLATVARAEESEVLGKALRAAGAALGLTQNDLGTIIGKDRSAVSRGRIDPEGKAGELALLLIRCYRALHVLVGGEQEQMRHWMHTENRHIGGIPAAQVRTIQGLTRVVAYLDAMRGKL